MRIVYVTETFPPEINGAALTVARALAYLRACGHDVQLVRPRQPGEPPTDTHWEWRTAGCPLPMYPSLRFGLAAASQFRARWAASPPDVVHVATPGPLAWAALRAARAEGIATTADFRTNFHSFCAHYRAAWARPLALAWLRRVHGLADETFVPTRECRDELRSLGFDAVELAGRGVDAHRFCPAWRDEGLREALGIAPEAPLFLHVGRLAPEKNVELALQTFLRVQSRCPDARMLVVGDGPLRGALQQSHPHAVFVGTQRGDELARHYASADVLLFPSRTETFGNVVLEGMASGLAVVAYDQAAAHEHLRDGITGLVAEGPSSGAFVVAALRALPHALPGSALRRRARSAALTLDWPSVLAVFERRLCGVVAQRLMGDAALA